MFVVFAPHTHARTSVGRIEKGKKERVEWARLLYPKNHELHLQRSKIRLLQIELGELMILVQNVEHHEDVQRRTEQLEAKAAKAEGKEYRGSIKASDWM